MRLTISSYLQSLQDKKQSASAIIDHYLKKAHTLNPHYNACLRFHQPSTAEISSAEQKPLAALPLMIKDNILIKDQITSCASKMLKDYHAPYTATCIQKLQEAWATFIAQTNMDEFAMGGSNENSAFGAVLNPHGTDRIPGGSSGGSAVVVATDMAIASLGTDTWGSVRQPASMCGIVGFKPSYGAISRYGVVAMASSLDQVGIFSKTVEDSQLLFSFLAGYDEKDATSSPHADQISTPQNIDLQNAKFFVPEEALGTGLDPQIKSHFLHKIEQLKSQGYTVDIKPFPLLKSCLAIYYTLMPSEVSTNLARFDGIRFGQQTDTEQFESLDAYYAQMRAKGFGEEVKRRILIGTFVLSSQNYESYYLKALKAQAQLKTAFSEIFQDYTAILTPTTPEPARKLNSKTNDPLKMYLADLYTVPANLAGLPAISVPMGNVEDQGEQLPVGLHIMAGQWQDQTLFSVAKLIEHLR